MERKEAIFFTFPFGTHKGKSWKEVPYSYLKWVSELKSKGTSPSVKCLSKYHMKKRPEYANT
jgi:hypothetical protein